MIAFLAKADVGSVIFSMDEMIVKDALFDCMKKFPTNAEVQRRYSGFFALIIHVYFNS